MKIKDLPKRISHIIESILNIIIHHIINFCKLILNEPRFIRSEIKSVLAYYNEIKNTVKQSFTALMICGIGGVFAGIVLGKMTYFFVIYPGLIILVPGAIAMRGNIFGSLGSRISSNLHIGILSPELKKSDILVDNISSAIILTINLSILLGFFAWMICKIINRESIQLVDFIIISSFSGIISGVTLLPLTILISIKSYTYGWDPDNIITPLIAAIGDLLTLPSMILSILIFSHIHSEFWKILICVFLVAIGLISILSGMKKDKEMNVILKQNIITLVICSFLGSIAGTILDTKFKTILDNPSIMTLVPLFSGENGNLASILGARLSSGLHTGYIEMSNVPNQTVLRNFGIIGILGIIIYPLLGSLVYLINVLFNIPTIGLNTFILICCSAGLLLLPLIMLITFYLTLISYKRGYDPDNIVIPFSTSLMDPLANLSLILMVMIFLGI